MKKQVFYCTKNVPQNMAPKKESLYLVKVSKVVRKILPISTLGEKITVSTVLFLKIKFSKSKVTLNFQEIYNGKKYRIARDREFININLNES